MPVVSIGKVRTSIIDQKVNKDKKKKLGRNIIKSAVMKDRNYRVD